MTVKEYLGQAYYLDQRINSKLEQVSSLKLLATKTTSALTGMPKSSNRATASIEDSVIKIVDMQEVINREFDSLVDLKREIVDVIHEVEHTDYQTLLELRYLSFRSWEQIANEMSYSVRHVYRLHDAAISLVKLPSQRESQRAVFRLLNSVI